MFETWLSEHGHEDEVNDTKPAQNVVNLFKAKSYHTVGPLCYTVEQLPNILESEHVQGILTKFAKTHSGNLNFRMWSTYMNMAKNLLDFIKAESDGNWTLLLEACAAVLPWLTINKTCKVQTGIIGITRNDQTRDNYVLCHLGRMLMNLSEHKIPLQDEEEETTFIRSNSLPS